MKLIMWNWVWTMVVAAILISVVSAIVYNLTRQRIGLNRQSGTSV